MKEIKYKEFFATSWAINNKASTYVLVAFITILGLVSFLNIPKEQFPEIVIPTILVSTPYPGTSPEDMENLVTRPIEKEIKSLAGIKKVTSNSIQDFSSIAVEFNTDVDVADAKQRVRDAVDKAKTKLPTNLPDEPAVMEIDFSEIPIMYLQLSGDYGLKKMKEYADLIQDEIEALPEITRVDIVGALEREIQIDVDKFKMEAASVTFSDIERAIASENVTISAGNINTFGVQRSLRVVGQFRSADELRDVFFKSGSGATVRLGDIATVTDGFKERESYSRLGGQNVITLNVIKKSGKNLIDASDKIKELVKDKLKGKVVPEQLKLTISGDMSRYTRNTLEELNNTEIIGVILVVLVLMFFMGFNNAFFVALSVPLSMFVAYMVMPGLGFTMNMIVMFGFIFALGIIVDDAIVVIENTHRIHRKVPDIKLAAKMAAGEVFMPILSGTLTTLAPFFPLAFWPGIVGQFMFYMPVTLILSLFASLFVAYIINPVFAVDFMKHEYDAPKVKSNRKKAVVVGLVIGGLSLPAYLLGWFGVGNFLIFCLLMFALFQLVIKKMIHHFQNVLWPGMLKVYEKQLRFFTRTRNAYFLFYGIIGLFVFTILLSSVTHMKVLFFPENMPNNIYAYIKMPVGTHQNVTDSVTRIVENKVYQVLGKDNPIVESVVANVGVGAGEDSNFDRSFSPEKGKVTINFVEYKYRGGILTTDILDSLRHSIKGIPGAEITVEKNRAGPPTGKPINIEVTSEDIDVLVKESKRFNKFLDSLSIPGIELLKSDFQENKPEILIDIDRQRAQREGISTAQVGMELRTALFGKEVSKFKDMEDEFPIQLRFAEDQRQNVDLLLNTKIVYRDMNSGILRQIPLSSVASIDYSSSFGGIKRKNMKRVITLSSDVTTGYSANEVLAKINAASKNFQFASGVQIAFTGEQESQQETSGFLGMAMLISLGLIFFILINQFKSFSKTLIILSEVIFASIGVLLGYIIFRMDFSIIMTGLGIVALGGIVVRNGILIVEFIDVLKERGLHTREAIIQAGLTRITPVVLTATATMLGLVPLALGMNINFVTMFTHLDPQIHFGGDNVMFWGPLSWAIIFGLSFATFLTLIFVPSMILIDYDQRIKWQRKRQKRKLVKALND